MPALLELSAVSISAPGGRPLFAHLDLRIEGEHVALVGRNGVGKSTLLAVLAGTTEADAGRVLSRGRRHFVAQADERTEPSSLGELRRAALGRARHSGAEILLLDEPSEHLDDSAVAWLRAWLDDWLGCLIVASHDRRLLADFRHFFIVNESGCRYFSGTLAELDAELMREHCESEQRYVRNLQRLAAEEAPRPHERARPSQSQDPAQSEARPRPGQPRAAGQTTRSALVLAARMDPIDPARAQRQPVPRTAGAYPAHRNRSRLAHAAWSRRQRRCTSLVRIARA